MVNCVNVSHLKKYANRPGPPYKAQDCPYELEEGNNGLLYESRPDKNGRFRWVKLSGKGQLVCDPITKKCRVLKRKSSKKSRGSRKVSRKPSKKASRKRSSRRRSKKTVAQIRAECKAKGLVYDTTTKRCRSSKRRG